MTLSDRIEQASEGSRELDAEIAAATGRMVDLPSHLLGDFAPGYSKRFRVSECGEKVELLAASGDSGRIMASRPAEPFTRSLDAAMTLVPEGWDAIQGWDYPTRSIRKIHHDDGELVFTGTGKTSALALCACALRARGL